VSRLSGLAAKIAALVGFIILLVGFAVTLASHFASEENVQAEMFSSPSGRIEAEPG
jgi:hypothetical protein